MFSVTIRLQNVQMKSKMFLSTSFNFDILLYPGVKLNEQSHKTFKIELGRFMTSYIQSSIKQTIHRGNLSENCFVPTQRQTRPVSVRTGKAGGAKPSPAQAEHRSPVSTEFNQTSYISALALIQSYYPCILPVNLFTASRTFTYFR